jgi:hypothetical protein
VVETTTHDSGVWTLTSSGLKQKYFACADRVAENDPTGMGLDVRVLPGGLYIRRKLNDWEKIIAAGKLGEHFEELIRAHEFDQSRPEIECCRSMTELRLLLPVLNRNTPKTL